MQPTSPEKLRAMSNEEIGAIVQRYLDDERSDPAYQTIFGNIYFEVDTPHIVKSDNHARVPVRPSTEPRRVHYMYGLLADINVEIVDKELINIYLAPGDPLESSEEARELAVA